MLLVPGSILDQPLYTFADVDRILGLSPGTAKRWINGYESARWVTDYELTRTKYDPVVREKPIDSAWTTWGEFVEVYYLSRFRRSGIPLQKLRKTLMAIRDRLEMHYLFANDKVLYADPDLLEVIGELQRVEGVPLLVVQRTGQIRFELDPEARMRLERITYDASGVARSLKPRVDLNHVIVSADRFFGKPKLEDTGISPEAVARLVWSGTPVETVSELYQIEPALIDEAGRFSFGRRWTIAA